MRANRGRDTGPERAVRSALHRRGMRFRTHVRLLDTYRGSVDIVFATPRVAVFIDGCFWHGCPIHWYPPRAHRSFWVEKVLRNRDRDVVVSRQLEAAGWLVIRIWEHDSVDEATDRIERAVKNRRAIGSGV